MFPCQAQYNFVRLHVEGLLQYSDSWKVTVKFEPPQNQKSCLLPWYAGAVLHVTLVVVMILYQTLLPSLLMMFEQHSWI